MVNLSHRVQVIFSQTGAENIGRGLQTITNYGGQANQTLQQTSTNLQAYTTNQQQAQAVTQQSGQSISIFGRNMQGFAGSTTTANQGISIFNNNLKTVQGGLSNTNTLLPSSISQTKSFGESVKSTAGNFSTLAIGISTTAQGAISLARNYRDLNDLQINIDRTARRVSLAQEGVDKAQRKVTEAVKAHGAGSKEAADANRDLTQAEEMLSVQTRMLEEQHEAFGDFQMNFAMSIIPTVIGAIGTMGAAFAQAGIKMSSFASAMSRLPAIIASVNTALGFSGLLGTLGSIATLLPPLLAAIALVRDVPMIQEQGKLLETATDPTKTMLERKKAELAMLKQETKPFNILSWDVFSPEAYGRGAAQLANPTEIEEAKKRIPILEKEIAKLESTRGGANLKEREYNNLMNQQAGILPDVTKKTVDYSHAVDMYSEAGVKLNSELYDQGTLQGILDYANKNQIKNYASLWEKTNAINTVYTLQNQNLTKTHDSLLAQAVAVGATGDELAGLITTEGKNNDQLTTYNAKLTAVINKHGELTPAQKESKQKWEEQNKTLLETSGFIDDIANKYGLKLNPQMRLTTKQIQEATKAFEEYDKAVTELKDPSELFKLKDFKVKFDVEDEFHDFLKSLPKGLRKDIVFNIKSQAVNENAKQLLGLMAKTALQDVEIGIRFVSNEKEADKYIDKMVQGIKDQFKRKGKDWKADPDINAAIMKLLEIKGQPDSWSKVLDYFTSSDFLKIIEKIDPKSAEIIQALLDEKEMVAAVEKAGTGIRKAINTKLFPQKGTKLGPLVSEKGGFVSDETFKRLIGIPDKPVEVEVKANTDQAQTSLGDLEKQAGSTWNVLEDVNETLGNIPNVSGKIDPNTSSFNKLWAQGSSAWNAVKDVNSALKNVPNVSKTIDSNAKSFDSLARSAGDAWNAISDTKDVLEEIDGQKYKATFEVEFKATGDAIAKEKAGGGSSGGGGSGRQYGGAWISNAARIWKGMSISEFNKPELNMTIPLTNPANITGKQTVDVPFGANIMGGGGTPTYQSIHLRIDGNDIIKDKDLYFNIAPQFGKNLGQYI